MNWRHKAMIQRVCDRLPGGAYLYQVLQERFGTLSGDPMFLIPHHRIMLAWLQDYGLDCRGAVFYEVGTGHRLIMPTGFFLAGAKQVITADLNRRLDLDLVADGLRWMASDPIRMQDLYDGLIDSDLLQRRLEVVAEHHEDPEAFMAAAGIEYHAPADASRTRLPAGSVDCHFSQDVMEHVTPEALGGIFDEARRILRPGGACLHFIDPSDHFAQDDKSIPPINFLRYPDEEWDRLAGNQFAYHNRLRRSDFIERFKSLGWDVVREQSVVDPAGIMDLAQGFPLAEKFRGMELDDLAVNDLRILLTHKGGKD